LPGCDLEALKHGSVFLFQGLDTFRYFSNFNHSNKKKLPD
jgi:hypothetical protein